MKGCLNDRKVGRRLYFDLVYRSISEIAWSHDPGEGELQTWCSPYVQEGKGQIGTRQDRENSNSYSNSDPPKNFDIFKNPPIK